MPGKGVERLSS